MGKRLGFDIAKDVATSTLVGLPDCGSLGVILRGNLPVEKILVAAKSGSDSQAVVCVGKRFMIKTFLLSGMDKLAEKMPTLAVPIDDKTLLVVEGKEEKDVQPFLSAFDGKIAKLAMPPDLDALCERLAPVHGVLYLPESKDDIIPDWHPDCKGIWLVQSGDTKTMRLRLRMLYGETIATEHSVKELLLALPVFFNKNCRNPDGTPNSAKVAQYKRWTELNSAIKLTTSGKIVSVDLDYPSAEFLKIIEVFRPSSAEKP